MSESSDSPAQQEQHPGAEEEAEDAPHSTAYVGFPGVRFVPSDQELIIDYLWPKLLGDKPPTDLVHEADVYGKHPRDLTNSLGRSIEGFWYVFSKRNRKYAKGKRPSRSTGTDGRWKAVGKNLEVRLGAEDGNDTDADGKKKPVIGHKCGLSYELFVREEGASPSSRPRTDKTDWKMCELVAEDTNRPISSDPDYMLLNDWVLCKISRKAAAAEEEGQQQPVEERHEDEEQQTQGAPPHPDPWSQQAQAMPNMPYLPHDGSDGTEVVQIQGAGAADLELPEDGGGGDGGGGAMDVQFDDWPYHDESWADHGYGMAFGHEQWNVVDGHQFGATADADPMVNRFEVPADPYSAVNPIELPSTSDPWSWDIAGNLLFSDDGHELNKANGDVAQDNTAATKTPRLQLQVQKTV